jgi:ankyrin repeat protein
MKKLVEKRSESAVGMMISSVDEDGNTPLHLACYHGYEEVALYLINNQADIGARYNNIARGIQPPAKGWAGSL